jgi:7-alpha-hydroxysteroid dehydrogenase
MDISKNAFSLEGKVALITGSGRGIGAGIARVFANAGAAIAVTGRTKSEVEATAAEIKAAGGRAIAVSIDFNDVSKLPGLIERTVSELGGLDILINNAGGATSPAFLDTRIELLESMFHLIVAVPFELARLSVPHMLKRSGASIINTLSPGAYKAPRGDLAYYTVKAGLAQMTKLMAADLGPRIRVNAIIPGPVETPALTKLFEARPEFREMANNVTRMRRIAAPEEIGLAALYLASPASAFVTGVLLPVDGGLVDELRPVSPDL